MTPLEVIKWICVGVFGITALLTMLALINLVRLGSSQTEHDRYLRTLFRILIAEVVITSVTAFAKHLIDDSHPTGVILSATGSHWLAPTTDIGGNPFPLEHASVQKSGSLSSEGIFTIPADGKYLVIATASAKMTPAFQAILPGTSPALVLAIQYTTNGVIQQVGNDGSNPVRGTSASRRLEQYFAKGTEISLKVLSVLPATTSGRSEVDASLVVEALK